MSQVPRYEALARYGRRGRLNAAAHGAMISALTTRHKAAQADAFAYDTTPSVVPFTWEHDHDDHVNPKRGSRAGRVDRDATRLPRHATGVLLRLLMIALSSFGLPNVARALEPSKPEPTIGERVQALVPDLEAYIASGMKALDVPGLGIGIVASDKLVYAKGFGVRSKGGGVPVDTRTIFQIGSTTKAFLAATMAIMVDRGKLRWDDRIVDLEPDFQLKDPWVTREFRVFDLLAQRSGLPPYANDALGLLGLDEAVLRPPNSICCTSPLMTARSTSSGVSRDFFNAGHG